MRNVTLPVQLFAKPQKLLVVLGLCVTFSLLCISANAQTQTIDFEGLAEGQVVNSLTADGGFGPVTVFGTNPDDASINAAIIFDSSCPGGCSGGDPDLGSPNRDFGGPGIDNDGDPTMGGNAGSPFENDQSLGNILIIHEHLDEIVDGSVADPDDDAGITSITINFPEAVTMYSFDMIDRENNESQNVVLFGAGDVMLGTFNTPATGDNGIATVATDSGAPGSGTAGVLKMVMTHKGSGGLDNIVLLPPPPPGDDCTYTQGFWKNHPADWPVDMLTLGGVTYDQNELLAILDTAPKGDKTLILAHQLIATMLNVANGADDSALGSTIADANNWLAANGGVGSGEKKWNGGEPLKNMMDDYNNGIIGPGHCGDSAGSTSAAPRGRLDVLSEAPLDTPTNFSLEGNYPNPFNPQTVITFSLAQTAQVHLAVYDMLGRELEVLVDGTLQAGHHAATFNAGELPSGTYLYRLVTPEGSFTDKMILAK